jgi:hypothetical protein
MKKVAFRDGVDYLGRESQSRAVKGKGVEKKYPTLTITQAALQRALGIDGPVVWVKAGRKRLWVAFVPMEMWPVCKECGVRFSPSYAGKTRVQAFCERNCARRYRYRITREPSR